MKNTRIQNLFFSAILIALITSCATDDTGSIAMPTIQADFEITSTTATYNPLLKQIVLHINVLGVAGNTVPFPVGQLNGAPVLAYVFPTSLSANDVGFGNVTGIVAMALTSHPDFDDTPLWDENNDRNYLNDGIVWHSHWVLLQEDTRVKGGLSVKEFNINDTSIVLPPTNPGMPMYLDSPGFQVVQYNTKISVVFPASAVNNVTNFNFDAITALLKVNTTDDGLPLLGVYEVYDVASGDLSLPYTVQN